MTTKYLWPLATSVVVMLLGVLLLLWPFAVHTNVSGWTDATTTEFWTGIGVAVVGLIMLWGWYGGLRKELLEIGIIRPRPKPQRAPEEPTATPEAPHDDLDRLLRPLAETVLRDLTEQLQQKEANRGGGNIA